MSGAEPTAAPAPSGGPLSPRNWRVATRLNAILLIPVLVGLVMGGFQVKSSIDTWQDAEDAERTALLVRASLTYAHALDIERDTTVAPLLKGSAQTAEDRKAVTTVRAGTDKAAEAFDRAARNTPDKPGLKRRLGMFHQVEPKLHALRTAAYTSRLKGVETEEGYLQITHPLMEFANELGLRTGNITSYGRTVYALSLTKSALSLQRSIGMHMLLKPGPTDSQLASQRVALSSYAYLERVAVLEYRSGGTAADAEKLERAEEQVKEKGSAQVVESRRENPDYVPPPANPATMLGELAGLSSTAEGDRVRLAKRGIGAENWWAVNTLKFDAYREIESDLADASVAEASRVSDNARRDTYVTGAAVLIALLAAFVLAGMVARQMSRSMRELRSAAFGIAEQRLPLLVDQLSRTDPGRVDTRVAPIPIATTDEIGEVARAFDQVHREAVRLAAEQALLRGNINAIFTNLSRRNQSLIEGQLALISDLETNEADPEQLSSLFRLDHLATRMRRNGENLLVLAGEEPGRRWDQPVPLIDVLRAASSEVEQYERIELQGVPDAEIHGRAVTDLVHLLAELLENATTFSSPQTKVRVAATRLPDGRVMVEIHDKGIGLTAEDFADINHRLANPPTVDAAISQRMGLFVVGRLSDRHGIRVQLRPSGEQAGTTSLVMLPDAITHGGGGEGAADGDEFTVSQIIPEQNFRGADAGRPMRTAAELGFDDSRYTDVPDDIRGLDPVGRSLGHEERRAAPEQGLDRQEPGNGPQDASVPAEQAAYPEEFVVPGYDDGRGGGYQEPAAGYDVQQTYPEQPAYAEPRQPSYGEGYHTQNGGYPESAPANGGEAYAGYEAGPYRDDWAQPNGYQNGRPSQYPSDAPEAESAQAADASERERVGFERPGPAPSAVHELTDAGLPRRGSTASGTNGTDGARHAHQEPAAPRAQRNGDSGWRSANDERWQQASQLRKPKAGGVTPSGLPRRVPRANLVEGTAETTPQGGSQVSRAPEDVRGRLSNLRSGVERGRNAGAGSDKNGQATRNQHRGPDSTYNQER